MRVDELITALHSLPASAAIGVEVKRELIDITCFGDSGRRAVPGATFITIAIDRAVDTSEIQKAVSCGSHERRIRVDE